MKPEQNKYDTDSPTLLDIDQVSIYYDNVQAVWDVTFGVSGHSVTALVGSNGAGKTAIMKSISGLLPIAGGTILFEGKAIEKLPCHRRVALGISLVPEGRKVFPYLTTQENLELGAYTRQARKSLSKTLGHVYTLFPPLENRKKQVASSLSGGEQQMLSIGRGLMSCPRLLMLDEPSLGLAPLMVKLVFEIIETIKSEGVTILLVEQNVRHTLQCARTAYILETGKITLAGKGKDLLDDPHIKKAYLGL